MRSSGAISAAARAACEGGNQRSSEVIRGHQRTCSSSIVARRCRPTRCASAAISATQGFAAAEDPIVSRVRSFSSSASASPPLTGPVPRPRCRVWTHTRWKRCTKASTRVAISLHSRRSSPSRPSYPSIWPSNGSRICRRLHRGSSLRMPIRRSRWAVGESARDGLLIARACRGVDGRQESARGSSHGPATSEPIN